eukprot:scaffold34160_cov14-Tisochrysis_lutea.AAC.1
MQRSLLPKASLRLQSVSKQTNELCIELHAGHHPKHHGLLPAQAGAGRCLSTQLQKQLQICCTTKQ